MYDNEHNLNDDELEILSLYNILSKRIRKGTKAVIFNQAAEMMYQLDVMIKNEFPPESIVEFVREYQVILYDED